MTVNSFIFIAIFVFRARSSTLSNGKDGVKSEYKVRDSSLDTMFYACERNIYF